MGKGCSNARRLRSSLNAGTRRALSDAPLPCRAPCDGSPRCYIRVYFYLALVRAHRSRDLGNTAQGDNHRVEFCRRWVKKRTKLKDRRLRRRLCGRVAGLVVVTRDGRPPRRPARRRSPPARRGGATRWRPPWHTRAAPSGDAGRGGAPMMCCDERQAGGTRCGAKAALLVSHAAQFSQPLRAPA